MITKGPWYLSEDGFVVYCRPENYDGEPGIAQTVPDYVTDLEAPLAHLDEEQARGNARAIRAIPEMVDLLKMLRIFMNVHEKDITGKTHMLARIDAALESAGIDQ